MGIWEDMGDTILSLGRPLTNFGLGFWIIIGIGLVILIGALVLFR
jgi:hypothetical protein